MPIHTASYFAGVGTVVATVLLGFGGGVLMTDAFVGKKESPPTLAERRASPLHESTPAVASSNPVAPASQPVADVSTAPAPSPVAAAQTPTPSAQLPAGNAAATPQIAAPQTGVAPVQASPPSPLVEQPRQNDNAMAMVRADDVRKALAERRKDERRKWADQRRREQKKIDELNAMAEKVRQAERDREPVTRSFYAQSPVIRLLGDD